MGMRILPSGEGQRAAGQKPRLLSRLMSKKPDFLEIEVFA